MQIAVSVITCTHNPRADYIEKVLQALKKQTFPKHLWEFLLIDNASDQLLSEKIDLSWHPNARHIREEQLGLTHARIRGIKETATEVLVFVDDDNVLDSDFLELVWKINKDWSTIGVWGGQIKPEFEVPPPEWTKSYWSWLAIREFDQDKWSTPGQQDEIILCGAGLCVRKIVAQKYVELVSNDSNRARLDRKGKLLTSCGDSDLALTAYDVGLGTGQFTSLKLSHLIPPSRLEEDYLLRLAEGLTYSGTILDYIRQGKLLPLPAWKLFIKSSKLYQQYLRWRFGSTKGRFYEAINKGVILAQKEIIDWQSHVNT